MYRPTASKQVEQYFEPLKKGHLGNTSEHLKCVISSNLKDYLNCVTKKTLMTKSYKLPLDASQVTHFWSSDRIPRNRVISNLGLTTVQYSVRRPCNDKKEKVTVWINPNSPMAWEKMWLTHWSFVSVSTPISLIQSVCMIEDSLSLQSKPWQLVLLQKQMTGVVEV
jgi:hypothetical protein